MKPYIFFSILLLSINSFGQIVINTSDMPQPDATIRYSLTSILQSDFTRTGNDTTWDFSELTPVTQRVDTFLNATNTPPIYWFIFTPGLVTTLAIRNNSFPPIPGLTLSNNFTFYKNSSASFSDVGMAFQFSGIPLMVKYDTPDKYYEFPCSIGNTWSSVAFSTATVPGLGFYSTKRTRNSIVDGYGTLITPFGTFETIRVKSGLIEEDSIYLDSLNIGIPYNQTTTEYKWLAKGKGTPVLQVIQLGLVTMITYQDIDRHLAITERNNGQATIIPNPSSGNFHVMLPVPDQEFRMEIFTPDGRTILQENINFTGQKSEMVELSGEYQGILLVRLTNKNQTFTSKLILIR
jgi:hypothetical protein